jgi:hypothetical protein
MGDGSANCADRWCKGWASCGNGNYVSTGNAGDYLSADVFEYVYEPGFGEDIIASSSPPLVATQVAPPIKGSSRGTTASVAMPTATIQSRLAGAKMSTDMTFAVPLPRTLQAFAAPSATNRTVLNIRAVPSHGQAAPAPALRGVSIGAL